MYSKAYDSVKVVNLTTATPVDIRGWKSICLECIQPASGMVTADLNIKGGDSSNGSDGTFISLSNQSVKYLDDSNVPYQTKDGLPLTTAEKLASAKVKRLIVNTMGFDASGNLVRPAKNYLMVTGAFASMRLILAEPEDRPQL